MSRWLQKLLWGRPSAYRGTDANEIMEPRNTFIPFRPPFSLRTKSRYSGLHPASAAKKMTKKQRVSDLNPFFDFPNSTPHRANLPYLLPHSAKRRRRCLQGVVAGGCEGAQVTTPMGRLRSEICTQTPALGSVHAFARKTIPKRRNSR